jgi:hypothetical protein
MGFVQVQLHRPSGLKANLSVKPACSLIRRVKKTLVPISNVTIAEAKGNEGWTTKRIQSELNGSGKMLMLERFRSYWIRLAVSVIVIWPGFARSPAPASVEQPVKHG